MRKMPGNENGKTGAQRQATFYITSYDSSSVRSESSSSFVSIPSRESEQLRRCFTKPVCTEATETRPLPEVGIQTAYLSWQYDNATTVNKTVKNPSMSAFLKTEKEHTQTECIIAPKRVPGQAYSQSILLQVF